MRIASWNVNGLRAVAKRNFLEWMQNANIDILCLQELKLGAEQLPSELAHIPGFESHFNFASKRGYAGVAVYTRHKPLKIAQHIFTGNQFNQEGRLLLVEFEQFTLLNLYMPHGGRDKSKLAYKLQVYGEFLNFLRQYQTKPLILAGDFNIAHHDIDLARPRQNRQNIMFTSEEREKIEQLLGMGFVDSYRFLYPHQSEYTWWPYIANARTRNIGWRLDYLFVSTSLKERIGQAGILSGVYGSDHCPVYLSIHL